MTREYKSVADVAEKVVGIMRENRVDVDSFRNDVLDAALATGREISSTLDEEATRQLKAALQFLYALADAATQAPKTDDGNANPDVDGGFLA